MTTEAVEQPAAEQKEPEKSEEDPAGGSGTESDSDDSVPDLDDAQAQMQSQVSCHVMF